MSAEAEWFARSPPLAAWVALGMLLAFIVLRGVLLRPRRWSGSDTFAALAQRLWRLALAVAFVPFVLVGFFFEHSTLAVVWWLLAAGPFAVVLLVTVGMAVVLVVHRRRVFDVPPHQLTGTAVASGLVLLSALCIPLGYVALSEAAQWDPRTSLASSMCAAYLVSILDHALVHAWSEDANGAPDPVTPA